MSKANTAYKNHKYTEKYKKMKNQSWLSRAINSRSATDSAESEAGQITTYYTDKYKIQIKIQKYKYIYTYK